MASHTTAVNLGDRVRERLTGVEGIAIAITLWRTGCNHVGVKREGTDKDGKPHDLLWFDEPEIDILAVGAKPSTYQQQATTPSRAGGPSLHGYPASR